MKPYKIGIMTAVPPQNYFKICSLHYPQDDKHTSICENRDICLQVRDTMIYLSHTCICTAECHIKNVSCIWKTNKFWHAKVNEQNLFISFNMEGRHRTTKITCNSLFIRLLSCYFLCRDILIFLLQLLHSGFILIFNSQCTLSE